MQRRRVFAVLASAAFGGTNCSYLTGIELFVGGGLAQI